MAWMKFESDLLDIVDTPISPELIPADETEKLNRKQKIWWVLMNYMTSSYIISYVSASGFQDILFGKNDIQRYV